MQDLYQKTLCNKVSFEGIGLHSGKKSKIKLFPANEDHGIVFKRVDIEKNNIVKAIYKNVSSAKLCTTLENENGVKVSTVEHLLAALYISGIDNVMIEINAEEVPIMDGSAKKFLDLIKEDNIKNLSKKRKYLKILSNFEYSEGNKKMSIEPSNDFEVDFQLDYKNSVIGNQRNIINFDSDDTTDVTNSRTFCLYEDIEKIKKIGLAKGGSLDNAVVVEKDKVLNDGGLRNKKEFVNHKILDLVGDFLLSGHRILGKVKCFHGGHELTNNFLRAFLRQKLATKSVELNNIQISKKISPNQSTKIAVNA